MYVSYSELCRNCVCILYKYYKINLRMNKECTKDIHETKLLREFLELKKIYGFLFCTHTHTPKQNTFYCLKYLLQLVPHFPHYFHCVHFICPSFIFSFYPKTHSIQVPSSITFQDRNLLRPPETVINTLLNPKVNSHTIIFSL